MNRKDGWCWIADDPEMTYPDASSWLDDACPLNEKPEIQRFDWGVPAPSTWLVYFYGDDGRTYKEFDSEAEAKVFAEQVSA